LYEENLSHRHDTSQKYSDYISPNFRLHDSEFSRDDSPVLDNIFKCITIFSYIHTVYILICIMTKYINLLDGTHYTDTPLMTKLNTW
jgi:hypothetical protein